MWRGRTGLLALALWPRRCRCEEDVAPGGEVAALWRRPWQADWDGRAPVEKMKAVGRVRHLIFVRHGQYDLDGEEHGLTELGKRQSERLAQRLDAERQVTRKDRYGEIRVHYAAIWVSNVTRAMQTAQILAQHLEVPLMDPDPLLAEGKPTQPLPSSSAMRPADLWEDSVRMEAGFRKYVHRDVDHKRLLEKKRKEKEKLSEAYVPGAPEEVKVEKEESKEPEHVYEIYVCHMNLIRYIVMRSLQLPPEAWLRLRGDNTNITEIVVQPDGRVSLHRFGDIGHLPLDMVTFH